MGKSNNFRAGTIRFYGYRHFSDEFRKTALLPVGADPSILSRVLNVTIDGVWIGDSIY
jgi:hypothetical protein